MRMRKLRNITKPGSSLYICVGEGVLRDFTLDFTVSNVQRRTKCRIFTRMTKFFVLFCKKGLTAQRFCGILIKLEIGITIQYLGVAQLVARYRGVVEAAGSSPVTQTKKKHAKACFFGITTCSGVFDFSSKPDFFDYHLHVSQVMKSMLDPPRATAHGEKHIPSPPRPKYGNSKYRNSV